jgi:hypothetical protein
MQYLMWIKITLFRSFFNKLFRSFSKRFGNLKRHTTEQVGLDLDKQLVLQHANMFDGLSAVLKN